MKKILALILALLMLCSLLCACGSDDKDAKAKDTYAPTSADSDADVDADADADYGVLANYLNPDDYRIDTTSYDYISWDTDDSVYCSSLPDSVTAEGIEIAIGMTYQEVTDNGLVPEYDFLFSGYFQSETEYSSVISMLLPSGKEFRIELKYVADAELANDEEVVEMLLQNGTVSSIEMYERTDLECAGFTNATTIADMLESFGRPYYAREYEDRIVLDFFTENSDNFQAIFAPDGSELMYVEIRPNY